MYLNQFVYFAPRKAHEAFELAGRLGKKASVLAGGTDLLLMMKEKLVEPDYLIDITGIEEFRGITYEPGKGAVIGAVTKISEIENSPLIKEKYYALYQAASELGSAQVRSMATIGGNSCHASPAAETPISLVCLGAKVIIGSALGERELPLEEFIKGNRKTVLVDGEFLTKFILPEPLARSGCRYAWIGLRDAMEIDTVNMAVKLQLESDGCTIKALKLVMGSVAPVPLVSSRVPEILVGRKFNSTLVEEAVQAVVGEASPISDIRASAEYRRAVVTVLACRLIQETFKAAKEV